jgi:hypothetical protein
VALVGLVGWLTLATSAHQGLGWCCRRAQASYFTPRDRTNSWFSLEFTHIPCRALFSAPGSHETRSSLSWPRQSHDHHHRRCRRRHGRHCLGVITGVATVAAVMASIVLASLLAWPLSPSLASTGLCNGFPEPGVLYPKIPDDSRIA